MAATPTALRGLVAVSKNSKVKPLGYIVWFSVPDEPVAISKLKRAFVNNTLPAHLLIPSDQKEINVFKRAMREQEGTRRTNGHIVETTVRDLQETPTECVYQVSSIVRNLNKRIVEYPPVMRVVFDKKTGNIDYSHLGAGERSDFFQMSQEIEEFFFENGEKISGPRLRTTVRNFLRNERDEQRGIEGLSGEPVGGSRGRRGGPYFVLAQFAGEIEDLSNALDDLKNGAYLHAIPLADGASERELIRRHHIENTMEELENGIRETQNLLAADRKRAARSDVKKHQWMRLHAIKRRTAKYVSVLQEEQDDIADLTDALEQQLDKLTD